MLQAFAHGGPDWPARCHKRVQGGLAEVGCVQHPSLLQNGQVKYEVADRHTAVRPSAVGVAKDAIRQVLNRKVRVSGTSIKDVIIIAENSAALQVRRLSR